MIGLLFTPQPQDFARIQTLQLEAGREADGATLADLDGDGAQEILLAVHESGKDFARSLEIWRPDAGGAPARAETITLTPDVVAFAHADVRAGGGEELLLFNAGGVFVWRSGPEARPERLLACEFLWQTGDPELVFEWQEGVRDLDGDGLVDLVLPEPGGFLIALQRRPRASDGGTPGNTAPWGVVSRVRVPPGADVEADGGIEGRRDRASFSLQIKASDGSEESRGPLVALDERVPAPFWLDWDADSDLDLLLQTARHLHVWIQAAEGGFSAAPQHSLLLPVAADTARELDASYSAHAVDLDLDRRADCVIFAGDKRSDDVRAQGLFFTRGAVTEGPPLFGEDGRPASLLVFAGFVSDPSFRDLDGDGYPELVLETVRPDLIDQLRSTSSESIDADLHVYRNRRGVLSRQPDLTRRYSVALDEGGQQESEFFCDLTGDGLAELVVRDEPEKLRILMLCAQGPREKSTWSLLEKPLWELDVASGARIRLVAPVMGGRASLFVLESSQVLWVRFG